jgi:hypothetical protein
MMKWAKPMNSLMVFNVGSIRVRSCEVLCKFVSFILESCVYLKSFVIFFIHMLELYFVIVFIMCKVLRGQCDFVL